MKIPAKITALKPLVVVVGPTAVGKSRVGIALAKALNTEVLTADSRQVFRGLDIATDKPTVAEREGIPHRLIDLVKPDQAFSVGTYRRLAVEEIDRLSAKGRVPLVIGGTGLYVRALTRGLWEGPSADWQLRARLMEDARRNGCDYLHRELSRVDPDLAGRLHPRDEVKIIRGLEVYHLTGRALSEVHRDHAFRECPFTPLLIGLMRDRQALYRRIDDRVDLHLDKGLLRETEQLVKRGYGRHLASMKGLGYRQMCGYLAGDYDYTEAVRRLKRDTRHFAKRQVTWFRKEPNMTWLTVSEGEPTHETVQRILEQVDAYLAAPRRSAGRPPLTTKPMPPLFAAS